MRGAAAIGTAGYVAKAALDKPVSFESKSLDAANTIYDDLAPGERIKKASQLRTQAFEAARKYGGGADQAMEIIQGLAAGGLDGNSIDRLLPTALKTVVAGKLQSKDVTKLLLKGLKNKMFTLDQADLAMDEGLKGGKQGSFEFKDMAKYLPQFAALGTGMKSHAGYQMHIANSEAIETVSADPDQAGNNYINLLQKLNAPDVKRNFKKKGINLTRVQLQAAAKGIDPVTAMADAVESLMHKSKGYQKLKKKLAAAQNDDERRQIAEQMVDIMQGSQLAQLIPDRQALTGLVGITSQKAYRDEVLASLRNAAGTVEADHSVIASGTEFKEQQLATEKDYAASKTHDTVKPWLDKGLGTVTDLARENPAATTAAYAGGTAMHIRLRSDALQCDVTLLLTQRTFIGGRSDGTITDLTLKPWGVWLPDTAKKPRKKKKKSDGDECDCDVD
jgi:Mu-like prophage tail protein gpP